MNADTLPNLVHTPIAKALGWTLFHSLWEGAIVAIVLLTMLAVIRSARARYAAACVAMLAITTGFVWTFALVMPGGPKAGATMARVIPLAPPGESNGLVRTVTGIAAADMLPWLAPFWVLGVIVFQMRGFAGWMAARRLRHRGICLAPDLWRARLDGLRARLGVSKAVALLESAVAEAPLVIGWLRPAILAPIGMFAGMPAGQIEAILMHELAHIRRHDYLINLLQTAAEGLLFYHPAVWWISHVIRTEREHSCDDLVVAIHGNAPEYAAALAVLEQTRQVANEMLLAATGGSLMKRIRRLLYPARSPHAVLTPAVSAAVLTVAAALAVMAWPSPAPAQSALGRTTVSAAIPVAAPALPQAAISKPTVISRNDGLNPEVVYVITDAEREAFKNLRTDAERAKFVERLRQQRNSRLPLMAFQAPQSPPSPPRPAASSWSDWLNMDVAYIVTDAERRAFNSLQTDEERARFAEQFWERRNPTPGSPDNPFRIEHYRRIVYANAHFGTQTSIPGWKTDRGRIYIMFGPPDELDAHHSPAAADPPPYEDWLYRYLEGIGSNVMIKFVDTGNDGVYRMTMDPNAGPGRSTRFVRPQ